MTIEEWIENSHKFLKKAETWNKWVDEKNIIYFLTLARE